MSIWVNGRSAARIDARDRGLAYGDGAFETMRVRRREVRLLDFHLDRLAEACQRLDLRGVDLSRLRTEITGIAKRRPEAVLKLILTRGVGARGYRPGGDERCTRVLSLHSMAIPSAATPARVRLCAMRLGVNCTLAGLKTLNRLESVLARAEWSDARIWEGLLRDTDDNIVSGTMSNLFIRRGPNLLTPKVDRCGVAGVMRRWVLGQAHGLRLRAREARLRWEDLGGADEAFMTNAIAGIVPVAMIHHGARRIRPPEHATARELHRRLEAQ